MTEYFLAMLLLSAQVAPSAVTTVNPPEVLPEDSKPIYRDHYSPSCKEWRDARASKAEDDRLRVSIYRMWVLGYITGFNIVGPDQTGDLLGAAKHEDVYGAIDGYCARNPTYMVVDSMRPIAAALIRRRQETSVANGTTPGDTRRAMIVAPIPCRHWEQYRGDAILRLANVQWVRGYLTAYNRFGPDPTGDAIGVPDQPLIEQQVDKWCNQHPSTLLIGAITPLIDHVAAERDAGRLPPAGMRPNERFTPGSTPEPQ